VLATEAPALRPWKNGAIFVLFNLQVTGHRAIWQISDVASRFVQAAAPHR